MINILSTLKLTSPISDITVNKTEINVLDDGYILSSYSLETLKPEYKHLLVVDGESKHIYDKSYALSNKSHAYISDSKDKSGKLYTYKEEKFLEIAHLKYHENAVSYACFSNNARYLAIGDEDGKAFFYDTELETLLFSRDPMADSISDITFAKDNKQVAISSFDKSTILYNIQTHYVIAELHVSDVVEDSLFFDENTKYAGVTRNQKLFVYDIEEDEITYSELELKDWPTCIIEIGQNHFLIGGRGNYLTLVNSQTLQVVKEIELEKIGIKTLTLNKGILYIGYIDGTIDIVNTLYKYKEFEIHLDLTNFKEATALIKDNIFLLTTKAIKKYDEVWPQVLDIAKDLLIKKDLEKSVELVKPFFFDLKKKEEYLLLNSNKKDIETFINLVRDEKIILAFKYADANEYLKEMKEYKSIEAKWQKIYQTCKALLIKDDPEANQKAISTLTRYSTIKSKSENINHLIKNYKDYARAQTLVKARNFRLYFILAEKKPYLTLEDLYKKVVQLGQQTYTKLLDLEKNGDYNKAEDLAKYLLDFTDFKEKATCSIESIGQKRNLEELIEADDLEEIYNVVDENEELENLKAFIEYHKKFEEKRNTATEAAKDGDTPQVYSTLYEYLKINNLKPSMAFVFKMSYLAEMKNAAISHFEMVDWGRTIDKYVKIYGADNEIVAFCKKYALTHILMSIDCDKNEETQFEEMDFYDSIIIDSDT